MFAQILILTFVFCLGLTAATMLISRQLLSTYAAEFHRHHFYYLAAFHAFAFYSLWGQVLARALLASTDADAAVIELVAGFLPVFGVPFLFVSWLMLLSMAFSMFGKVFKTRWLLLHTGVFLGALLGAWVVFRVLQGDAASAVPNLGLIEAGTMIGAELLYFGGFLALVVRCGAGYDRDKRRILSRFSALLFAGFAARSLLAGLALVDIRLSPVTLLAYFASNLPALLYLRASADRAFQPVKAVQVSNAGMEHMFERYGVTKRERQIVQKICLGKTNQQIANELFISLQTVKDHTHRIYSKIGINSRMQLVQLMNSAT
jgi:DNA-binding CsgD family transcriptional regulator